VANNAAHTPATDAVGRQQANATYTISNDYLYPRRTVPPMLRQSYLDRGAETNPYKNIGLLRGFIYPIDINSSEATAAITSGNGDDPLSASDKARQEVVDAYNLANSTAAAGATVLAAALAATPLAAVGPSRGSGTLAATANDPVKQPKRIRYAEGKQFQFNPMALSVTIGMTGVAPTETVQTEGTAGSMMVGQGETGIQLYFDRSLETAAASRGALTVNGHSVDPIFADIGVQKDLWDVYRIILGGDENYFSKIGNKIINIDNASGVQMQVRPGSATDMFGRLFDLGASGTKAWGRRVALFFNPNLVIIGDVTSIGFVYAEFNANYVPTKAKLDLGIQILSTTSESGADAFNGTDTTTDTTDDSTSSSSSSSSSSSNDDTPNASTVNGAVRTVNGRVVVTRSTPNGGGSNTYTVNPVDLHLQV
jgi:hypothetical protein